MESECNILVIILAAYMKTIAGISLWPLLLTCLLLRVLCGSRVRVEMSTGMSRKGRGRPSRRQFDPNDRCYQCGDRGHYAYDCYRFSKRGGRRGSR